MARGKKKEKELTPEEKLQQALVPVEEQPYKIPENWCWTYIKIGFDVTSSKRVHKSDWLSEGIPFYRTRELVKLSEQGYVENELFISQELYDKFKLNYGVPKKGDLLISGVGTIGVPYVIQDEKPLYFKDGNVIWFKSKGCFLSKYVYHLYKSSFIRNQIYGLSAGTTVDTYTIINAMRTVLPLPPLMEQQRIVDRIESLFAKLDEVKEKAQAVVDGYEDRKAAILHKAFTGELTEGWRNSRGIHFNNWKRVTLQSVCEKITCGKTPKEYIQKEGEIPYLKVYNIVNNSVDFESNPQYIPTKIHSGRLSSSILKPNDVIMNIVGPPLRKIAIIPDTYEEWNMNQAIVRFRPKEMINHRFLYYSLINPETLDSVINETRGVVGQANISVTQSRNLSVPLPPIEEQLEIVRILDDVLQREKDGCNLSLQVIDQTEKMKKGILARAFRGELGTNDPSEESAEKLLKQIL